MYIFADARHAMGWATEILRMRELTGPSQIFKEYQASEVPPQEEEYSEYVMPTDGESRYDLAHDVYTCFHKLNEESQSILKLAYWGDFASMRRLNKARVMQESLLRKGVKTRLNYRYSIQQLSTMLDENDMRVKRRLDMAHKLLHEELAAKDLLPDNMLNILESQAPQKFMA